MADRGRELAERRGITLLMDDAVEIAGVRFLGSTLWTDFRHGSDSRAHAAGSARRWINDYRRIRRRRSGRHWLSTKEAEMAMALNAVVVRENATFVAVPNDVPIYKVWTFNRMLNNGARAQYEAIASAKLAWLGIPELRIPSFYTSLADLVASTVSETRRRGEKFVDASGKEWHADEHAGLTIPACLLLRVKETVDATNGFGVGTSELSTVPL
jgi:hypothetical protein